MSDIPRRRRRTHSTGVPPGMRLVGESSAVRAAKVRAARARIRSGFYERGDVKDRLALAVLAALRDQ